MKENIKLNFFLNFTRHCYTIAITNLVRYYGFKTVDPIQLGCEPRPPRLLKGGFANVRRWYRIPFSIRLHWVNNRGRVRWLRPLGVCGTHREAHLLAEHIKGTENRHHHSNKIVVKVLIAKGRVGYCFVCSNLCTKKVVGGGGI